MTLSSRVLRPMATFRVWAAGCSSGGPVEPWRWSCAAAAADHLPSRYGRGRLCRRAGPVYAASRYLGLALARGTTPLWTGSFGLSIPHAPLQLLLLPLAARCWVGMPQRRALPPVIPAGSVSRKFTTHPFFPHPLPLLLDPRLECGGRHGYNTPQPSHHSLRDAHPPSSSSRVTRLPILFFSFAVAGVHANSLVLGPPGSVTLLTLFLITIRFPSHL
jgi:hypothetical protein